MQRSLASGWNTWDTHSVAAQVLLPEAFTVRVGLRHNSALYAEAFLPDVQIGLRGKDDEDVTPGPHTWNGSYTEIQVRWRGDAFRLETAHAGQDLVMLATPLSGKPGSLPPTLIVSAGVLWNRPGGAARTGDHIEFNGGNRAVGLYWTGTEEPLSATGPAMPHFSGVFRDPIGVSTGRPRSVEEIRTILARERPRTEGTARAIETVMGWDTLYDPSRERVISPVSRLWSSGWGGYVLFDWDTFFAASLAATGDRNLAYADAIETLREETPQGFVPNYARAGGWKSCDRSEPPVGALTVLGLYSTFHETWLLRDTFDALMRWNRWWDQHRQRDGYLVLGSDAANQPADPDDPSVGTLQGAKYESGLDNSPLYDDAPFDPKTGMMEEADVGLMGLYVADCNALAEIARVLGKSAEKAELEARSVRYTASLGKLWDEESGIFLNRNLKTGAFVRRMAPTCFYPLLARAATPAQAARMVREHLMNPAEFWGEWALPSIARSDTAFKDQDYWRGRIWGPMNYLVYLGLRNYDLPDARRGLAEKSLALFNKEWSEKGHVHENYNALTGSGDDVTSSDRFYHWGALLGLMGYLESPR